MFWLKGCPRCTGDLYEDRDLYGRYIACAQCGYYLSEAEEVVLGYTPGGQAAAGEKDKAPGHVAAAA